MTALREFLSDLRPALNLATLIEAAAIAGSLSAGWVWLAYLRGAL